MGVYKAPKFVKFKNVSKRRVVVEDLGIDAAPGEECLVQDGYAMPRRSHAGDRFPSVLEQLAGCGGCPEYTNGTLPDGSPNHKAHCLLEPVEDGDKERFSKAPNHDAAAEKAEMPTVETLVKSGVPRGVAEQLIKAMKAAIVMSKDDEGDDEKKPAEKPAPAAKK